MQNDSIQRTFRLTDFGAALDGATDDTAALQAACAAINRNRGGRLLITGICRIIGTPDSSVVSLSSCSGLTIECVNGGRIRDTRSYTDSQQADLFTFAGCDNVNLRLLVSSQPAATTTEVNGRGLYAVVLREGCRDVDVDLTLDGCVGGLRPTKAHDDPAAYISRNIRGRIRARGTYYPYVSQFGANGVDLQIDTETCGRNFFIYGSRQQRLTVFSKNQQATSLIKAYNGHGCSDVDVRITDLESDDCNAAAPVVAVEWGDSAPATHRNIRLHMNVKSPTARPWGNTIEFSKYSDGGGTPDRTGRGHVLDGFELTGYIEGTPPNPNFAMVFGALARPDVIRRFNVHCLTALKGSLIFKLPVLEDVALFENVHSDSNVTTENGTNGVVRFISCTAGNFTATRNSNDTHEYYASRITNGLLQNYTNNKRLFDTRLPDGSVRTGTYGRR